MSTIVNKFGNYVSGKVEKDPDQVRRLLLAAYKGKLMQLQRFPDKRLSAPRNQMAVISMQNIIQALSHPEQAALVNIFMPCEILQALDIHPIVAEAMACYVTGARADRGFIDYSNQCGLPETFCSYHRILLAELMSGVLGRPKFVANTSLACDANNLTFKTAASYANVPQFYIDVPYEINTDSIAYVADQLREFAVFAQDETGKKLSEDTLKEHVASANRTMHYFAAFQKKKADKYLSNDVTDELYEVFGHHVLLGMSEVEQVARSFAREADSYPASKGVRLLWMHTIPYYQESVRELLNFSGRASVIACDMCFDEFCEMDPEKPYESMAKRLVSDSFNGQSDRRIDRALEWAQRMKIDGIVYFCHWGCKQTIGAAQNAKKTLEGAGFPTLILDGDGCDESNSGNGQISTRLTAFIEMLEEKKS